MTGERSDFGQGDEIDNHEHIRQTQDRTHTLVLLDVVLAEDPSSAHWSECLETLRWLEDYRTIHPLRDYIQDRERPDNSRCEVAQTLSSFDLSTTSAQRRSWWNSGDPALQEYALRLMEPTEADLVAPVAKQHGHPLQAAALTTLAMNFERPRYQTIMVRGLNSDQHDAQLAAVSGIIWDEPVSAEPVLGQLIRCGVEQTEQAAVDALQYYPSLTTLEALRQRMQSPLSDALKQQVRASIDCIEGMIDGELQTCGQVARTELAGWVSAIDFVADESLAPMTATRSTQTIVPFDEQAFDHALDTTAGTFPEKVSFLRTTEWSTVAAADQNRISERLSSHPDPEIRAISTIALAQWNDAPRLLVLARDKYASVRKSAMYSLASVDTDPHIATFALERLNDLSAIAPGEALATFAKHADSDYRRKVLFDLAMGDDRFSVRRDAIVLLDKYAADAELEALLSILGQPPFVNWAVHTAILEANVARRSARKDLVRLVKVDNIHIAAAAARSLERASQVGTHP